VNMNAYLVQQDLPVHYTMARMVDALVDFRYSEKFPSEAPMELFFDPRVSLTQVVEATVSVIVTTPHMSKEIYDEASAKGAWRYFRPKFDGVYTWSVDFGDKHGSVLFSHNKASFMRAASSGYSFERVSRSGMEDLCVAHASDHVMGFSTILEMENAFGPQRECIVGVWIRDMMMEFKVKDLLTFEMQVKANAIYDAQKNNYGVTTELDGIYEVAVIEKDGESEQRSYMIVRPRPDKSRPQSAFVIQEALGGPRYRDLCGLNIGLGSVVVGALIVGRGKVDAPVSELHNRDIFDVGDLITPRPFRLFLSMMAANHVRLVGRIFEVSKGRVFPTRVVSHCPIPGGVLGAFVISYRGPQFIHPIFPQTLLQSVFSAVSYMQVTTPDTMRQAIEFIRLADAVRFGVSDTIIPDTLQEARPMLQIFLGSQVDFEPTNLVLRRLLRIMKLKLASGLIGAPQWAPSPIVYNTCYGSNFLSNHPKFTYNALVGWDKKGYKKKRTIAAGKLFIDEMMERGRMSGGGSHLCLPAWDVMNPECLTRDISTVIGPTPWTTMSINAAVMLEPSYVDSRMNLKPFVLHQRIVVQGDQLVRQLDSLDLPQLDNVG